MNVQSNPLLTVAERQEVADLVVELTLALAGEALARPTLANGNPLAHAWRNA
jgi:hypothetical protein